MSSTNLGETDKDSRIEEAAPNPNVTIKGLKVLGDLPAEAYIDLKYGNQLLATVKLIESNTGNDFLELNTTISHTIQTDEILFELYQSRKLLRDRKLGSATLMIQSLLESRKRGEKELTEKLISEVSPLSLELKVKYSVNPIKAPQKTPCQCTPSSRNLVVCIDGTANQFGMKNTNVVELYSRLVEDDNQLTYYNSGIGTYVKDSWASPSYWKQVVSHSIDMAIAWNFKRIVLAAYTWLCNHYRRGDRIFFFGFSRGAYQIRVLAGMIEKVGLLRTGNIDQIPFVYEWYLATTQGNVTPNENATNQKSTRSREDAKIPELSERFKTTFSRHGVKVHFVGAWDTVSSIGVVRGPSLPETTTGMKHVCHFRHALALDELRVKFLPEYANGGIGPPVGDNSVKEVWFAGSHSDIGGGNTPNPRLNKFGPALRWMTYEAISCGLKMEPYRGEWETLVPKESLTLFWRFLEILPVTRLSYKDREHESMRSKKKQESTTRRPHLAQPRQVQPGQLIHESVLNDESDTRGTVSKKSKENRTWMFQVGQLRKVQPDQLAQGFVPGYTPKACIHSGISWDQTALRERNMLELDIYAQSKYVLDQLQQAEYILNEPLANILITLSQSSLGQRSMTEYPNAVNVILDTLEAELKRTPRSEMLGTLLMVLSTFPPLPGDHARERVRFRELFPQVVRQNQSNASAIFKILLNLREPLELEERLFDDLEKIHPIARTAWFVISSAYETLEFLDEDNTNVINLYNTMTMTYLTATERVPNGADKTSELLEMMIKLSIECSLFLSNYSSKRYLRQLFDGSNKINEFKEALDTYSVALRTTTESVLEAKVTVPKIVSLLEVRTGMDLEVVEERLKLLKLSGLLLKPRSECLNGTRHESLKKIISWVAQGQESILWLSGVAGCGKSSLMGSLYNALNELGCNSRLAAFIRFDRNEFNDPHLFVGALVRQLASFDGRLGQAIIDMVQQRANIAEIQKMSEQLELLVLGPLKKCCTEMQQEGPIAIVIDGLDECMQKDRESFSELLQLFTNNLFAPFPHVQVIIASRPEYAISKAFTNKDHIHHFPLDITSSETQADVRFFLKHELSEKKISQSVASDDLDKLAERASGLFVWARVIVDFIAGNPEKRLSEVIKADPPADALNALTILYCTALDSVVDEKGDEDVKTHIWLLLGAIMAAGQTIQHGGTSPASTRALQVWISHHPAGSSQIDVSMLLDKLQSVLLGNENSGWSLLHKSFDDFLTDQSRCGDWFINVKEHIESLASISTSIVTSFVANPTVGDIDDAFCYASYYWIPFWCALGSAEEQPLSNMLRRYFLQWIYIAFLHNVGVTNDMLQFSVFLLEDINGQLPSHFYAIWSSIHSLCMQGPGQKTSSQFIKFFFHYLCTAHLKGHNALFQCYMPVYVQLAGGSTNYTDIEAAIGAAIEKDPTWMPPVLADDADDFLGEIQGIPEEIDDHLLHRVRWGRLGIVEDDSDDSDDGSD